MWRKPKSEVKTYLWYISPFQRFMAQGAHQQAAFDALPAHRRRMTTNAEFCVHVPSPKFAKLGYMALHAMSQGELKL